MPKSCINWLRVINSRYLPRQLVFRGSLLGGAFGLLVCLMLVIQSGWRIDDQEGVIGLPLYIPDQPVDSSLMVAGLGYEY